MYGSVQREFHGTYMKDDVYIRVGSCATYAQSSSRKRLQRKIQLVPASGPPEFMAMDIFDPLDRICKAVAPPCTGKENYNITVSTNRYNMLTKAISKERKTTSQVNVFFELRITSYCIWTHVLIDSGNRILSKLFATLCTMLNVKRQATTTYDLQINS